MGVPAPLDGRTGEPGRKGPCLAVLCAAASGAEVEGEQGGQVRAFGGGSERGGWILGRQRMPDGAGIDAGGVEEGEESGSKEVDISRPH
jgi:hypothetical protein